MNFSDRNMASFFVDGATVLIVIGMIIHTTIYRKRNRLADRVFFEMLIIDICMAVFDALVAVANGRTFKGAEFMNLSCMALLYISQAIFGLLVLVYLLGKNIPDEKKVRKLIPILCLPDLAIMLMYLIGIPNGYFIAVDENNRYFYSKLYALPVAILCAYGLAAFVMAFIYRRRKDTTRYMPVWLYLIPVIAMLVVPYAFKGISLSAIGVAIMVAYMHIGEMNQAFFEEVR